MTDYSRRYRKNLKQEIMNAYGGKCECCDEDRIEFLTIEHIHGDGKQHRESVNSVYLDLKKRGFPRDGYTCLCINCNFAKGQYGYCPHERKNKFINEELDWLIGLQISDLI